MPTDMYNTYDNDEFCYYTSSSFDNRTKKYLLNRYSPRASWEYKDTVAVSFNIHDCNITNEEIAELEGKAFLINFYNNRFEVVYTPEVVAAEEQFSIFIDYETSCNVFKRGTYYCSIELVEYADDSGKVKSNTTILPMQDCCFYVV